MRKLIVSLALLVGIIGGANAQSNAEGVNITFKSDSYNIQMINDCKAEGSQLDACDSIQFVIREKNGAEELKLVGRTMNHRYESPNLFGYTASQAGQTYIVLIKEETLIVIKEGELQLEEKGKLE